MTPMNLDKHYEREIKMQQWRILTPMLSIFSTVVISCLAFFMVRMINQFDQRNDSMLQRIEAIAKDGEEVRIDVIQKYSELRYRCCSEIKGN